MSFMSMLNNSFYRMKAVKTEDGLGGFNYAFNRVDNPSRCRIKKLSARERAMSGSTGVEISHKMYSPLIELNAADYVIIGTVEYDVQYVNNWNLDNRYLEVGLMERNRDGN